MQQMRNNKAFALLLAIVAVAAQVQRAEAAADTGNVIAGLLGTFIGIIAICAFLGWWSRRSGSSESTSHSTGEESSNI